MRADGRVVLVRVRASVSYRRDRVVELVARARGPANFRLGRAAESLVALVEGQAVLARDRESVSFPRGGPAVARLCYQVWATGRATLAIGRASFRIERPRSGATIFKTALLRGIGMIASKTGRTGAMTGKIAIRTFMTATKIGIMGTGTTTAIGGATCGVTIPR